ncbi:MAG: lactate utilization protein [Phycisphaeraceae bacterium]|nr:MAG: lactate utilization protein [Phycisphaeraceae bacterium]
MRSGLLSHADCVARFGERSAALKTRVELVPDIPHARDLVAAIAGKESWSLAGVSSEPIADQATEGLACELWATSPPGESSYDRDELARCDAGVTGCLALIAETGSILVTAADQGGRALSVLPPHHVVIATAEQLRPDLASGYAALRERHPERLPTQVSFITGPSRTGDIERILVLGAHGPKRLTVILIDSSS